MELNRHTDCRITRETSEYDFSSTKLFTKEVAELDPLLRNETF